MSELGNALQEELEQIWSEVSDVSDEERQLAQELAVDAAKLGARAVLGDVDQDELEIVKSTRDQLTATAARRAARTAELAVSRVVRRLVSTGLGLL